MAHLSHMECENEEKSYTERIRTTSKSQYVCLFSLYLSFSFCVSLCERAFVVSKMFKLSFIEKNLVAYVYIYSMLSSFFCVGPALC